MNRIPLLHCFAFMIVVNALYTHIDISNVYNILFTALYPSTSPSIRSAPLNSHWISYYSWGLPLSLLASTSHSWGLPLSLLPSTSHSYTFLVLFSLSIRFKCQNQFKPFRFSHWLCASLPLSLTFFILYLESCSCVSQTVNTSTLIHMLDAKIYARHCNFFISELHLMPKLIF